MILVTRPTVAAKVPLLTLFVLATIPRPAPAQSRADAEEIAQILGKLRDPELVTRTYGAVAAQHFARKQWGFALFTRASLRPWQRALAPAVAPLVEMLAEDAGLEWIDQNGNTEQTTTPRQEATRALLALERPAIEPLIAALDRPPLARKSDELLRRIVRGGPAEHDRAGWERWWSAHRTQPLPNEHGQWWLVALGGLLLAAVATWVFRRQRGPKRVPPLSAVLHAPAPAASSGSASDSGAGSSSNVGAGSGAGSTS
jgi:hypothetical protein